METHWTTIRNYIRSMLRDGDEAEDLTQETFLRAHRERETLRDAAAQVSWLYRIATRVTIDRLRQRARAEARRGAPLEALELADRERPSALRVVEQAEMSACVRAHLERLSDADRAALLLHDHEGLTADEIASLLELPPTTVKMRLHRARRRMAARLAEACRFGRDDRGVFVCAPKRR